MRKILLPVLFILITPCLIFPGDFSGNELFPQIKGWQLIPDERVFQPQDLWDFIDGAADSYLDYEFMDLHLGEYEDAKGIKVRVELYRHSTFNNTFGIYTSERSPDYHFIDIGSQGYLEEGALNFLCGNYYVKVTTSNIGDDAQDALVIIAKSVDQHLGQDNNWPEIYKLFPEGMIKYSEHYIAENFLGFEFLHSAFTANYIQNEEDFQVFIIRTDETEEVKEMLRSYLKFTKQDTGVSDGPFKINDPYNGNIDIILKGNTLAGIIDCSDEKIVDEYLQYLNSKF